MAISIVSFSFSWCLTGGPGSQLYAECWLSLPHLVTNGSPKLLGVPRAPSTGCGFPYHISSLTHLTPTVWLPVLTKLYDSSTHTQSPTQSLEWHVWSSSSGNNCPAVQRSLSSGASVYECIIDPFRQPNPPTRFLSITGHWNVSLPSGELLWNDIFGWVEGQYITIRSMYFKSWQNGV